MVTTNDKMNVIIRQMEWDDVDTVHEIEVQIFPDPWAKSAFFDGLGEEWSACFVAVHENRLLGYLCAVGLDDELHVHNIAVSEPYRRRGIGRNLLAKAESWACRRNKLCSILDVRESNKLAISLYNSMGYRRIDRHRQYYNNPVEDALVFMKILPGAKVEEIWHRYRWRQRCR